MRLRCSSSVAIMVCMCTGRVHTHRCTHGCSCALCCICCSRVAFWVVLALTCLSAFGCFLTLATVSTSAFAVFPIPGGQHHTSLRVHCPAECHAEAPSMLLCFCNPAHECYGCNTQATHNSFIWVPNAVGAALGLLQLSLCLAFRRKARMDPDDAAKREPLLNQAAEEERDGSIRAGLLNQRRGSSGGEDV